MGAGGRVLSSRVPDGCGFFVASGFSGGATSVGMSGLAGTALGADSDDGLGPLESGSRKAVLVSVGGGRSIAAGLSGRGAAAVVCGAGAAVSAGTGGRSSAGGAGGAGEVRSPAGL